MSALEILEQFWQPLLAGLQQTLALAALALVIAVPQGFALGWSAARFRPARWAVRTTYLLASAVPLIVILYWTHYPLQEALGVVWNPFWVATGVLSQIAAAVVAECTAHAISQLPPELSQQALAVGLSRRARIRHVLLPVLVARIAPDLLMVALATLQGTLFTSLISVPELFRSAQQINAAIHAPIAIYTALAAFFFIACAPLFVGAELLKRRLRSREMLY